MNLKRGVGVEKCARMIFISPGTSLVLPSMAESGGIEPRTKRCLRFSKPLGEPTPAFSISG